ncbi:CLUMA_CG001008, isoform A [Clunio marinus]|uniref:CLUMA_CG001008, isoform A n=1 Tax=Clunio marinus TaxID=568069 RepID=A0A1J1HIH5_9DIPT|nr:CLUMA_CG001008, isoform A [Clunio marinus]
MGETSRQQLMNNSRDAVNFKFVSGVSEYSLSLRLCQMRALSNELRIIRQLQGWVKSEACA